MGVIIFHEYRWRKASARARTYFKNESALSDNFFRNFFITLPAVAPCCFFPTITNPSVFNHCRRKFKIIFPFLFRDKIRKIIRFVFSVKIFFKQNKFPLSTVLISIWLYYKLGLNIGNLKILLTFAFSRILNSPFFFFLIF